MGSLPPTLLSYNKEGICVVGFNALLGEEARTILWEIFSDNTGTWSSPSLNHSDRLTKVKDLEHEKRGPKFMKELRNAILTQANALGYNPRAKGNTNIQ